MNEYWSKDDVIENAILDLQHERDELRAEIARRDEEVAELRKQKYIPVHDTLTDAGKEYYEKCIRQEKELARRDEIIARLKEDGERLASESIGYSYDGMDCECVHCKANNPAREEVVHLPDCPITLHRALMKELE